jgi:hypothetical protein
MKMSETNPNSEERFRLSDRVLYRAVDDEGVLVHLENGRVMVVNEVALYIVRELDRQAITVSELAESVSCAFEVDAPRARVDVLLFLDQLREEQAIDTLASAGEEPTAG